jgi:hypothetical protein
MNTWRDVCESEQEKLSQITKVKVVSDVHPGLVLQKKIVE